MIFLMDQKYMRTLNPPT